jgi:hypothetical protein
MSSARLARGGTHRAEMVGGKTRGQLGPAYCLKYGINVSGPFKKRK